MQHLRETLAHPDAKIVIFSSVSARFRHATHVALLSTQTRLLCDASNPEFRYQILGKPLEKFDVLESIKDERALTECVRAGRVDQTEIYESLAF